jgi:hypothetical protein
MDKEKLYNDIQRAIMLIEDGCPHMAKAILESVANELSFNQ